MPPPFLEVFFLTKTITFTSKKLVLNETKILKFSVGSMPPDPPGKLTPLAIVVPSPPFESPGSSPDHKPFLVASDNIKFNTFVHNRMIAVKIAQF